MARVKGKRILTSLYLDPSVADELRQLSTRTRVPEAVYLRDLLLAQYRHVSELIVKGRSVSKRPRSPVLEWPVNAAARKPK
jgi:Ribbon-helix-helix domain